MALILKVLAHTSLAQSDLPSSTNRWYDVIASSTFPSQHLPELENLPGYMTLCFYFKVTCISQSRRTVDRDYVLCLSYSLFIPSTYPSTWLTWDSIHANEREQANPLISEVPKAKCSTLSLLETPLVNGDLYTSSIKQCCFPQHFIHDTCTVLSTPTASMTFKSPFNLLG